MSPVQTRSEKVRERFLDFWVKREGFGAPIGCIATSYTFQADFFEEDCLGRFIGMQTQPEEDGRVYLIEREEKLADVICVALVDLGHVPRSRSLRWHLLPVRVPDGGIQHAKVNLLVWDQHVRVTVGSANLSDFGYRRNFEHLGVLDFTPDGEAPLALLSEALTFLEGLAELTPGATGIATEGPHAALRNLIARVRQLTADWDPALAGRGPSVAWLTTLPDEAGVFDQLKEHHWSGTGPDVAEVLSPFYNDGDRARQQLSGLMALMGQRGNRSITFRSRGHETPDQFTHLELPTALSIPDDPRVVHRFEYVPEKDVESELRPLHAKSLWLQRGERALFMIGSSNFTCAGFGASSGPRNVEANLVYTLPSTKDVFARQCEACFPGSFEAVNPVFLDELRDQTPEPQEFVPLPAGFMAALFVPEGETGKLRIQIQGEVPARFVVVAEDEIGRATELLTSDRWADDGRAEWTEIAWQGARPPSCLIVRWRTAGGEDVGSLWVVNVTDTARLPPPEELRNLSLEELVEILSSARPLHEVLGRRSRRLNGNGDQPVAVVFDPHKRVDTRNYLLRRVRRISVALEGLRQRLERPAYDIEGLRWRLHGPIGPAALARKLAEEEGEGAGFMIAEVAMTVKMADWLRAEEVLGTKAVRAEVRRVIKELQGLADRRQAPPNLTDYVRESFVRVQR
jgi:hypothetical protein